MSFSQDQLGADAHLASPDNWLDCLHQGLLIHLVSWITALVTMPRWASQPFFPLMEPFCGIYEEKCKYYVRQGFSILFC
jgi:hypothetical protein